MTTRAGIVLYVADVERMRAFYESVTTLASAHRDDRYVALEDDGRQLVLLLAPQSGPPGVRENPAIKPWFLVGDLPTARARAAELGGSIDDADEEFAFREWTLSDGVDPEGNVIQLRELSRRSAGD